MLTKQEDPDEYLLEEQPDEYSLEEPDTISASQPQSGALSRFGKGVTQGLASAADFVGGLTGAAVDALGQGASIGEDDTRAEDLANQWATGDSFGKKGYESVHSVTEPLAESISGEITDEDEKSFAYQSGKFFGEMMFPVPGTSGAALTKAGANMIRYGLAGSKLGKALRSTTADLAVSGTVGGLRASEFESPLLEIGLTFLTHKGTDSLLGHLGEKFTNTAVAVAKDMKNGKGLFGNMVAELTPVLDTENLKVLKKLEKIPGYKTTARDVASQHGNISTFLYNRVKNSAFQSRVLKETLDQNKQVLSEEIERKVLGFAPQEAQAAGKSIEVDAFDKMAKNAIQKQETKIRKEASRFYDESLTKTAKSLSVDEAAFGNLIKTTDEAIKELDVSMSGQVHGFQSSTLSALKIFKADLKAAMPGEASLIDFFEANKERLSGLSNEAINEIYQQYRTSSVNKSVPLDAVHKNYKKLGELTVSAAPGERNWLKAIRKSISETIQATLDKNGMGDDFKNWELARTFYQTEYAQKFKTKLMEKVLDAENGKSIFNLLNDRQHIFALKEQLSKTPEIWDTLRTAKLYDIFKNTIISPNTKGNGVSLGKIADAFIGNGEKQLLLRELLGKEQFKKIRDELIPAINFWSRTQNNAHLLNTSATAYTTDNMKALEKMVSGGANIAKEFLRLVGLIPVATTAYKIHPVVAGAEAVLYALGTHAFSKALVNKNVVNRMIERAHQGKDSFVENIGRYIGVEAERILQVLTPKLKKKVQLSAIQINEALERKNKNLKN